MRTIKVSEFSKEEVFGWLRSHYDEDIIDSIYAEAEKNIWGEGMHDVALKFAEQDLRNNLANQK